MCSTYSDHVREVLRRLPEAREVLRNVVHRTPLSSSLTFSQMTSAEVYLKLENLQKTGSFKPRGAYYAMWKKFKEGVRWFVAASSGNHAQGVAYAAKLLGAKATIVMPKYAPITKVVATQGYGAEVTLHGETFDDAYEKALQLVEEGAYFVHPFNDYDVIAGQGTIGLEIIEDLPNVDVVVVPVGGGGLISGISIAVKSRNPHVKVIGVQPKGAPAAYLSYKEGKLVKVERINTIADGVAIKRPGDKTLAIMRELVDDIVLVDDFEIARAVFLLLERGKLVAEPAGALAVAAILSGKVDVKGKRVVAVVSGGNVDMSLLATIIRRGLFLEGRNVRIRGLLPDRPGQLKRVVDVIAEFGFNIVTIEHVRSNPLVHPGMAEVELEIEVPNREAALRMLDKLKERGIMFKLLHPGEWLEARGVH